MGKKQPKKKTWRKADIADVEEAVEDERLVSKLKKPAKAQGGKAEGGEDEEELGDEFFTVDTKGSTETLSRQARREIARAKLFPAKGPKLGLSAAEEAKVERAANWSKERRKAKEAAFDLWNAPTAPVKVSKDFPAIRSAKEKPHSTPRTVGEKVGRAPAVLPAHEGQSMNPEHKAYEDLACTAAARELEREREAADLDRKIMPMTHELRDHIDAEELAKMDDETKLKKFRELTVGSALVDEDGDDTVYKAGKGRVKSQAQKNKTRRQKVVDVRESQEKAQKKLEKSVGEVGAILKQMKEEDRLRAEQKKYKEALRREKRSLEETEGVVSKRRRLGRTSFQEDALLVPDAEAAKKGMRSMPLQGGVIQDRLSSIMRRGLIPATPQASMSEKVRKEKKAGRLKRSRKFASPLAREFLPRKKSKTVMR
eukprot:TRINITY_DN23150_c0_g1_i1.p1 TRINITY_DN23150_c0_g1~~TRINITY_DN23150_c0_g1_i1.p1  ORF type:complete len:426 (+),score=166.41 TRINITY_DN23150_c0_g1_i1:124-1401(+)